MKLTKSKIDKIISINCVILGIGMILFLVMDTVNGQKIEYQKPLEDQVIVCIAGNVIEITGDLCKLYQADNDHPRSIQSIQDDLYQNPFDDTFIMDVRD